MMISNKKMPSAKTILSTIGSLAASAMLVRTVANEFMPDEARDFFFSSLSTLTRRLSSQITIVIEEFQGLSRNQVFEAAHTYLGTIVDPSTQRIKVGKSENDKTLIVSVDSHQEIVDHFNGVQVKWSLITTQHESSNVQIPSDVKTTVRSEFRSYELTFHKKFKNEVLDSYLPFILSRASAIREQSRVIKLHTIEYRCWDSKAINLDHPMNFDTLAMDSEVKNAIVDDLDEFVKGKEFYRRIGKAWKRGYLLYGPPGTGKSSLIAAMANYLNYDIYDMDLTDVTCNSDLRMLLLAMSNKAIVVFEDIDCTIKLRNREDEDEEWKRGQNEVTLSGLLNFIDGLLSCCGDERIMVFTTNHRERLDPALLRPGRMDMHIHMSYCTASAFRQLAHNYHGILKHELFGEIEGLIGEVEVTPAEVSGELTKTKDAEASLQCLLKFLKSKKMERELLDLDGEKKVGEDGKEIASELCQEECKLDDHAEEQRL